MDAQVTYKLDPREHDVMRRALRAYVADNEALYGMASTASSADKRVAREEAARAGELLKKLGG